MRPDIESGLLVGKVPEAEQWELAATVNALAARVSADIDAPTLVQVRLACEALNKARQFELCRVLAQAWREPPDLTVVRHLVQAQVELTMYDAAQAQLKAAAGFSTPDGPTGKKERIELDGLAARIQKQYFVASRDPDQLATAYRAYLRGYTEHHRTPYWFGVNAVALRARAEREHLELDGEPSADLAQRLYNDVLTANETGDPWWLATLSELCLALGRCDDAELWLYRFMHAPKSTPFMLASFDRQLRDIWQGVPLQGGQGCADRLTSILARHQVVRESSWSMTPREAAALRDADLEKVFSSVGSFSVAMIRRMLDACQSIGCVSNAVHARVGTGFLLDAGDIGDDGDGRLFVTNAHVLSDTYEGAIPPSQAWVSFELIGDGTAPPRYFRVSDPIYTSPPGPLGVSHPAGDLLDVTIVRVIDLPESIRGLPIAAALPLIDGKARAYVIGHPRGSGLQVSVHDSELLACDGHGRLLHYRTPTDPGSSGSPVFNEQWQIIALHHGGSHEMPRFSPLNGIYQANEGVTLSAIRAGYAAHRARITTAGTVDG